MESLVENHLYADVMHLNNHKTSTLTPELQFLPFLAKSFLQENHSLTIRPPSLFPHMPALRVLDLSHTMIQSLPPSISKLSSLEQFFLRDCSLLIELPPEIGALKNLKLFDLEGTEIMYIPKEIGKLGSLECLRVSLSAYADDHKDRKGVQNIIPRMTIMKLTKLKELSISVSPEAEWWEAELLEAIMEDLLFLPDLKTLKLYLPTAKALQQFLRLERNKVPIYSSLWNYRFITGHCEQLPFSVQLDAEEHFLKLEKCVKYMNGEGCSDEMMKLIRDARALYLRRHWNIDKLSSYDIRTLKYCLLMECNEMQTLVDQEDICRDTNSSTTPSEDEILGSLQYLSIHFMKKLQRISKGPIGRNSLSCLRILALHTCPELTSVFTKCLLHNLQNLTEIIVEDCPKVNCLVNFEEDVPWSSGPFLPKLRRVSLLHLPELVSVSRGVCIAPQLDTLLVFNCMKLDYLSEMEISRATMAIKGEIEWWDALKYGKSTWESVFVQLKRDESLMDQLAEDKNSLQHFLELKMVPSLPACYRLKHKMEVSRRIEVKETPDHDGYIWRKYGQKDILGSKYPRSYYRCNFSKTHACCAKKQVQRRCTEEPCVFEVVYRGKHTCPEILSSTLQVNQSSSKDTKEDREHVDQLQVVQKEDLSNESKKTSTLKIFNGNNGTRSQYAETAFRMWEPPSPISGKPDNKDTQCMFKAPNQKLASTKKKSSSADIAESIQQMKRAPHDVRKCLQNGTLRSKYSSIITSSHQVKVNKGIQVEEALDDGCIWRKYGEKSVCGSKYPRSYYRCSTRGCSAKKRVHRSTEDPSVFEVSYGGKHTCHTVLSNIYSSTATESACATTATESVSVNIDSHFGVSKIPQVLDSNKKMSGGAGIQRWKQQTKEIQFLSLKSQLPSSYEQNVKKETMGDRVTELQHIFSPFGKGRVSPVLSPACQPSAYGVNNLGPPFSSHYCPSVPSTGPISNQTESVFPARPNEPVCQYYMTTGDCRFGASCNYDHPPDWAVSADVFSPIGLPMCPDPKQDLRKQGLCLVPVSSKFPFTNQQTTDFSSHIFGEPPNESDAYKA